MKINTVIIKDFNDDEVLAFADFARANEVQVRFIEYMPFGEKDMWDRSKILSSAYLENLIRRVHDLHPSARTDKGPAKMFEINGSVQGRSASSAPCHPTSATSATGSG